MTTTTSDKKATSSSWRVRDAADNLLARRGIQSTPTSTVQLSDASFTMRLSKHFDGALHCHSKLRREKTLIVRMALDAAAIAILENLHKADDDDENTNTNTSTQDTKQERMDHVRLPPILQDVVKLQQMRISSMERAHANKDLSKRKIAVLKEQEEQQQRQNKSIKGDPNTQPPKSKSQPQPKIKLQSNPQTTTSAPLSGIPTIDPTTSKCIPESSTSSGVASMIAATAAAASVTTLQSTTTTTTTTSNQPEGVQIKPNNSRNEIVSSSGIAAYCCDKPTSKSVKLEQMMVPTPCGNTKVETGKDEKNIKTTDVGLDTSNGTIVKTSSPSKHTVSPTDSVPAPASATARKFTRNTPASSSSALEEKKIGSRAVICATANITFNALTPSLPEWELLDIADIPQNPNFTNGGTYVSLDDKDGRRYKVSKEEGSHCAKREEKNAQNIESYNGTKSSSAVVPNMDSVISKAKTLGQRIEKIADNAVKRSQRRYQFRKDSILFSNTNNCSIFDGNAGKDSGYKILENPFAWKEEKDNNGDKNQHSNDDINDAETRGFHATDTDDILSVVTADASVENSASWAKVCIPRVLSILNTGMGNCIIHDTLWSTRHARIVSLFQAISNSNNNFGLHLIVTADPDVDKFAKELKSINSHIRLMSTVDETSLRALPYKGSAKRRRRLRKFFPQATGLQDAAFHVIITSYTNFLKDYIHFCQTPFEIVLIDDGTSWMGAAHNDPNSLIATIWDDALFSKNDHQMGLAGSFLRDWDYNQEEFDEETLKDAWIGLTARHRLTTSSKLRIDNQKNHLDVLPVGGILDFVVPHFAEAVREEWERSRISNDLSSMKHFRKLLTRSLVVHDPTSENENVLKLAMKTIQGDLESSTRLKDPNIPKFITDEKFILDGKVASSRRSSLLWLGPAESSWLRYELGSVDFEPIIAAMKTSVNYGHICEEIVTASSVTTGATGQIFGNVAYKLALRCGRSFGSEQGLRQHLSTHHAPPGTWLCRTCKVDCVTSQARTHHERSCGQAKDRIGLGADRPAAKSTGGVSKLNVAKKRGKTLKGVTTNKEEKDADGSTRVPSYKGVWVDQQGKYFVKIEGDRTPGTYENIDAAAKKHDELVRSNGENEKAEFNFESNGNRIAYEDMSTSSTTSLGGGTQSVVPALSVINIKDLPSDVKPLLRDPRQTSRTGGNSKRHVYAYRGVCRQARKGHDRWQSQISFLGVNHYLGTFDSEWDAAAIYAWAHLILYGEEATRKAQKEGEEAAAAYEKEKRDIEAGIIPEPRDKSEKQNKKLQKKLKSNDEKMTVEKKKGTTKGKAKITKGKPGRPRKRRITDDIVKQPIVKKLKPSLDKESIAPILAKSVGKATVLGPEQQFENTSDDKLMQEAAIRLVAARDVDYCITEVPLPAPIHVDFRPCVPLPSKTEDQMGGAMLLGLDPSFFGWSIYSAVSKQYFGSDAEKSNAIAVLTGELGQDGLNRRFQSLVQGRTTIIGCASSRTQRVYASMGLGIPPMGGPIGTIDCNTGGTSKSCSETSCVIRYSQTENGDFQFSALSSDLITLNGHKITPEMGPFPLINEDICTVGSRAFVFLLPKKAIG